jgi:hypothetical protein
MVKVSMVILHYFLDLLVGIFNSICNLRAVYMRKNKQIRSTYIRIQTQNFFAVEYSHGQKAECEAQMEGDGVFPQ